MRSITVLISLYKAKQYLECKLNNILAQTKFTDSTIVILNCQNLEHESQTYYEFSKLPNVIVVQYGSHVNLYKSWNDGIRITASKYIVNSNVDDLWHPQYLEKCMTFLDQNDDYSIVSSDILITSIANQTYPNWQYDDKMQPYTYPNTTAGPCPVWRRNLHEKYGYFEDYNIIGDAIMWEKWYKNGEKFAKIYEDLVLYLRHPGSLERRSIDDRLLIDIEKESYLAKQTPQDYII